MIAPHARPAVVH